MLQVVREKMSDYDMFIREITKKVKKLMGEEYSVQICKVIKNNSVELDSLVLLKKGDCFSPNIYLLSYYEAYIQGNSMNELANRLCNSYHDAAIAAGDQNFTYSFDKIKDHIIYRLVSFERNKKLLEKIPHIRYLDLAITFHCLAREDHDGIGTIRITKEHMQLWETTLTELHELAVENTKRLFPATIRSMEDVICGLFNNEYCEIEEVLSDQQSYHFQDNHLKFDQHKMYILSNQKGINGATCLIYDNVLNEFSKKVQTDFFILPSSIHEVILLPYDNSIAKETLMTMVRDVNCTQVARDEVLSDMVYIYSKQKNAILFL